MSNQAGKGDKPRPCNRGRYRDNYDSIDWGHGPKITIHAPRKPRKLKGRWSVDPAQDLESITVLDGMRVRQQKDTKPFRMRCSICRKVWEVRHMEALISGHGRWIPRSMAFDLRGKLLQGILHHCPDHPNANAAVVRSSDT